MKRGIYTIIYSALIIPHKKLSDPELFDNFIKNSKTYSIMFITAFPITTDFMPLSTVPPAASKAAAKPPYGI